MFKINLCIYTLLFLKFKPPLFANVCLVWFFMSQSTVMVMSRWSVHLTTLFSTASLPKRLTSTSCTYFHLKLTLNLLESAEGRRTAVEIISRSNSMKVWDWAGIKHLTPVSAVRHVYAVRHVTNCATQPSDFLLMEYCEPSICNP